MPDDTVSSCAPPPVAHGGGTDGARPPLALAIAIQEARRRRRTIFPHAEVIFQEPAWDMLLDLFVADSRRDALAFEDLCDSANVRPTTALRWITSLEQFGLVEATAATGAGRPTLSLTADGRAAMLAYLEGI